MKAIVTGAAGFIGCQTAATLIERGWQVLGVDNLSRPGSTQNLQWLTTRHQGAFTFTHADVRMREAVADAFRNAGGVDLVIHAAAQVAVTTSVSNPVLDFETNASGTFNVLEAVRQFCPSALLIYTSTNKVYGSLADNETVIKNERWCLSGRTGGIDEEQPLDFHSPYGCSKGAADQYVLDYARIYDLRTVSCRQSCIYGPRQYGVEDQGWVAWFTIAAAFGAPITVYGDGRQVRDILWVDDLIRFYLTAYEKADICTGRPYNIGGGPQNTLSLRELIGMLPSLCGTVPEITYADTRPGDQRVYVSDIGRAERELGWRPLVSTAEGLERLASWVRTNESALRSVLALPTPVLAQ